MVVAVAKAVEEGAQAIVCASTGNTSASAAAYGATAGLEVIVVLPRGQTALGKLLQVLAAGARVVAVEGNFDDALRIVRALAEQDEHPVTLVNPVNPFRLDGQGRPPSRSATSSAGRRTSWRSPSATPGTSVRIGGFGSTRTRGSRAHGRRCGASRRLARRHRPGQTGRPSGRPWPRPSGSVRRRRGTRRSRHATRAADGSRP